MALLKLSALASDIQGKIGGSVFQKTTAGLIVKNIAYPVNKRSPGQLKVRNNVNILQQKWICFSQSQRNVWNVFSKYQKVKQKNISGLNINGQQMFLKYNQLLLLYNLPIIVHPEYIKCSFLPVNITISFSDPDLIINSDRYIDSDHQFIVLYATLPLRESINNPGSRYRLIIFETNSGTSWNITNEYYSTFNTNLHPGDFIFYKTKVLTKKVVKFKAGTELAYKVV